MPNDFTSRCERKRSLSLDFAGTRTLTIFSSPFLLLFSFPWMHPPYVPLIAADGTTRDDLPIDPSRITPEFCYCEHLHFCISRSGHLPSLIDGARVFFFFFFHFFPPFMGDKVDNVSSRATFFFIFIKKILFCYYCLSLSLSLSLSLF